MHRFRLVLVLSALLFPAMLSAQVGVYAGFSAGKLNLPNYDWTKGAMFGGYYDASHFPLLNFGVDLRGSVVDGDQSRVTSGMFGPRVVAHLPIVPLRPYLEGLVGGAHVQTGQGVAATDATHLSYGFAAGADLTFFPRFDWRVVDYQYTGIRGLYGTTAQQTISTGLVFRLPIP